MTFVGGRDQAAFMTRLGGADPGQCLVVPIDVGKRAGVAMIAEWPCARVGSSTDPLQRRLSEWVR
jgi:hypothetical protein